MQAPVKYCYTIHRNHLFLRENSWLGNSGSLVMAGQRCKLCLVISAPEQRRHCTIRDAVHLIKQAGGNIK